MLNLINSTMWNLLITKWENFYYKLSNYYNMRQL